MDTDLPIIPLRRLPELRAVPLAERARMPRGFIPGAAYRFTIFLPSGETRTSDTYLFPDQVAAMAVMGIAVEVFGYRAQAMIDFEWDPRYSSKLRDEGLLEAGGPAQLQ